MTDDVPTSDGTRHTEEAVNIPQVTDPRTSSLEDIAQVLSAKTPDIADDPHPEKAEKADSDGAGPAEGSAAEAASADADTHDADTETGTESVAESAAGDGPESSAEGKAESDAEADQDDAPVEEESEDSQTEAEAPREGDAVVEPGDSTDELSEGESVTDEDARPESEAAESDPDAEPESEAVEEAAEPDVEPEEAETAEAEVAESDETENDGASTEDSEVTEPDAAAAEVEADESQVGEGEPAAESEESSSAVEVEAVEESAEPDTEAEEAGAAEAEAEEDGAPAEDSEVTEPDAAAAEVEADESQVGEGEPAAESEESSSADEAEPVEEAAESAETEAVEAEVAESDETENDGAPAEDSETTESDAEVVETEEAEEAEAGESESDEPDEGASESVDDPEDGEPVEPDTSESSEKESEASEEEPQAVQAAADEASQDGSAVETEEEEAGAESKDAVAAPVGEALAAMSAPTPAEAPQPDEETSGPVDDQPGAEADEAEADEEVEADEADESEAASGDDTAQSEPAEANREESLEKAAEGESAVGEDDEDEQSGSEPADGERTDSEPEDETAEESASVDEEASQDGSAVEAEEEEAGAESKDAVAAPVGEALAAMSAPTPAETPQFDEIPAPAGDKPAAGAADEAARTTGASDSSGSSDGAAPEAAADSTSAASAVSATSAKVKAALVKAKAALMELLHGRGPGRGMMACIIGLGLLVLIWGGAAVATTQHIFAGSTVSGVDVGDMSPAEARQAVDDHVGAALTHPVILTVNDSTDTLVPADSGVSVDADASVDRLVGPTLNPVTLIKRLSGSDVDAVTTVDTEALTAALNERLDTLATGTADAVVTLDGTTPVVTPGATGTGLDVDASVKSLSADWPLGQEAIALASGTAKPAITDEDAQTFVDSVLTPLLADDLTITAVGTSAEKNATGKQLVLSPEQIASLTTISTADGELSAVLDSQRLHDDLIAAMGPIETQAVNAGWTIDGSATGAAGAKPQYVAPSSGEGIDMAALTQQLIDTGTTKSASADRTVAIPMTTTEPDTTTPEADWGITEVTGEFATPFNSEPGRDQNLIRGAEQMNGQVVMSGQTFSVEEALGPVDYEHGFTDAGVISNGQHVDALGGGLSQIGTTMFNVGFEAGMDDVEHHPHSYYFDRYPAGREATLWTGQKDVKFTNSTPYAALIQAWVADGQVHTRIWSTHYYDVSITSSERYNYRPVQTLTRPAGSGCQSYYGGNPGFDITVTRTRTAPDKTVPDDVLTTTYDADNNIECTGSAKPSQSLQPGSSTTDQGRSSWEAAPQPIGEADTPAAGGVVAQPQPAQPQDATGAEENLPNAPEGSSDGGSPAGTP